MPRKTTTIGETYFVTSSVVNWIDLFTRRLYFDCLIDNLRFCREQKGLRLYAYVIMTNHFHFIASCEKSPLNRVLGNFKASTTKQLIELIENNESESRKRWLLRAFAYFGKKNPHNKYFKIWQEGTYPVELYSDYIYQQKLSYLYYNPVKAGFVQSPEQYYYSSANLDNPLGEMDD